jgi:hypothetical protein
LAASSSISAQLGVGLAGLLGAGRGLGTAAAKLLVEGQQMLDHVIGHPLGDLEVRQAERLVERVALCLLQRDLQLGAAGRRLFAKKLLHRDVERGRQPPQQRELGLPLAVLEQGELGRGTADAFSQLGQRQAPAAAQVTQPLPERNEIYVTRQVQRFFCLQGRHSLTLTEEVSFFLLLVSSLAAGRAADS